MTPSSRSLRVLVAPFARDNQYQTLLYAGVSKSGCDVTLLPYAQLTLPFALLFRSWDVFHLHWVEPFFQRNSIAESLLFAGLFRISLLICRLRGIPVVWTIHQVQPHDKRVSWLSGSMNDAAKNNAKRMIVHAPSVADLAARSFDVPTDMISVVPHGHYIGAYPDTVTRGAAREKLGIPADAFVYVFVGQVRAYKGIDDLVDAFSRLSNPDAVLVVAGKLKPDDPAVRERYAKADPRIRFDLSFVPDEDLQVYLRAADVMVLPYRNIVTSGSVILGMSFGLPCVVPRTGSIPEVIPEEGAFYFEPGDVRGLEEALVRAFDAHSGLARRGAINLEAARKLDWDVIGAATRAAYEAAIG